MKFGMLLKDMKENIIINLKQNGNRLHLSYEYLIYNLKIPIVFGACREVKCYLESGLIYYLKIH